ncbi:hypothetical protein Cob_v001137 [Colletotrichum orbiculare MAFF 240422]|uniref:Restriction of telomere capping protein 4 n=1 Tax=Colletotrichum orbiculare (strain 104-T / ATCC 96160 / CBS 514.97 / LARS 414 / MAFF 240422) TaxID=1213857 RepID=N4VN70_COLOR|nr:hypothetical protein Cob_v001137 [Colletotrichum orbiculare MAFF 240422]
MAPPADSSSEDDNGPPSSRGRPAGRVAGDENLNPKAIRLGTVSKQKNDSDSDDDRWKSRVEISSSRYFGTSKAGKAQSKAFKASQESNSSSKSPKGPNAQPRGSKRASPDLDLSSPPSKRRKVESQVGNAAEAHRKKGASKPGSSFSYSQKDRERTKQNRAQERRREEKKAAKLKAKGPSSPETPRPSFKSYEDDPFEKLSSQTSRERLVKPPAALPSSPLGTPQKTFQTHPSLSPDSSPRKTAQAKFKEPIASPMVSLSSSILPAPAKFKSLSSSPEAARKGLKDPGPDLLDSDTDDHFETQPVAAARCPVCNEAVDKGLLDSFSKGGRMKILKQIEFCRRHKKKSAEDAWTSRGYPRIDWDDLSTRVTDHYDFLEEIINGRQSHYGALLTNTVKEGKNRTLLKAEGSLTPGYYGPRGLREIADNIVTHFSSSLRKRAVDDRLISSRGTTGFVEAVLVPEVTVKLICEDMKVGPVQARTILEESRWVGDMLQEEIPDVVNHVSDDDRDGESQRRDDYQQDMTVDTDDEEWD